MKTPVKILIVATLAVVVVGAVALKKGKAPTETKAAAPPIAASGTAEGPAATAKLPKLIDLGAGKCIPCKMMKPILDDLKANYADYFVTQFIDVWENPDAGKPYGIEVIPTQIFFDAAGKEFFRHVGFYG